MDDPTEIKFNWKLLRGNFEWPTFLRKETQAQSNLIMSTHTNIYQDSHFTIRFIKQSTVARKFPWFEAIFLYIESERFEHYKRLLYNTIKKGNAGSQIHLSSFYRPYRTAVSEPDVSYLSSTKKKNAREKGKPEILFSWPAFKLRFRASHCCHSRSISLSSSKPNELSPLLLADDYKTQKTHRHFYKTATTRDAVGAMDDGTSSYHIVCGERCCWELSKIWIIHLDINFDDPLMHTFTCAKI